MQPLFVFLILEHRQEHPLLKMQIWTHMLHI